MVRTTETSVFENIDDAKKAMTHLSTFQNISLIAGAEFLNHFTNHFQFLASSNAGKAKASGTISPFPSTEQAARTSPLKPFLIEQTSNDMKW
jgi:hypothetical protein